MFLKTGAQTVDKDAAQIADAVMSRCGITPSKVATKRSPTKVVTTTSTTKAVTKTSLPSLTQQQKDAFLSKYKVKLSDTTWNLSGKDITDADCFIISKMLQLTSNLKQLYLYGNQIGDSGAKDL